MYLYKNDETLNYWNSENTNSMKLGANVTEKEAANPLILVVEDDWLTLKMLKLQLKKRNYEVIPAKDEKEFWEHAFDPKVSLIILDICLRNRLGSDVYRSLLDFGANRSVPVIFTTGNVEESSLPRTTQVFREDHYAFMEKPFAFEELNQEIERLLHYRKIRDVA